MKIQSEKSVIKMTSISFTLASRVSCKTITCKKETNINKTPKIADNTMVEKDKANRQTTLHKPQHRN